MREKRVRKTSRELDQAAKELRRRPTPAEALLWDHLRRDGIPGYRFRRQHPVGRTILDFYCAAGRLCIELDGPIHDSIRENDTARDAWLATHRVRVLRFRNEEVFADTERVLSQIAEALALRSEP